VQAKCKLDEDIGFSSEQNRKNRSVFETCYRQFEILIDNDDNERYSSEKELIGTKLTNCLTGKIINTEAIAFIRGRSITKQWVIIDEAQNLTPKQVKGIITRAGKGTK